MKVIHTKCNNEFESFPIFSGLETVLYCKKCGEEYNSRNSRMINKDITVLRNDGSRKYFHYIEKK